MNSFKILSLLAVVLLASCKSPFEKIDPSERNVGEQVTINFNNGNTHGTNVINYNYPNADKYKVGDAVITSKVQTIDVDWIFGSVKVAYGAGKELHCSEQTDNPNDTARMRYWLDGTTLHIRFCRAGNDTLRLRQKDLTILLPKETEPNLQVSTVSAEVDVENINAKNVEIETASGCVNIDKVAATDIDLNSVSGNIILYRPVADNLTLETASGEVMLDKSVCGIVDIESVSGDVALKASSCKTVSIETCSGMVRLSDVKSVSCDVETVSGDVELLTNEKNLAVSFETVSGEFNSSIPFTKNGDVYKMGSGSVKIDVETASGDLNIKCQK